MVKHFRPRQSRKKVIRKLFKAQQRGWHVQIERTNGHYASNLNVAAIWDNCFTSGIRKDKKGICPDIDWAFKEIWEVSSYYKAFGKKERKAEKKAKEKGKR